jgi:hypothetical protein
MQTADITFDDLNSALQDAHAPIGAAEAHGIICGTLCAPTPGAADRWQPLIFDGEPAGSAAVSELLNSLYQQTSAGLGDEEFGFALMTPDERYDLTARVGGLAGWCRGFVFGLIAGGVKDIQQLPGDAPEIVNDLVAIAEISADAEAEGEQQEQALAEIEEYVRAGVQLIYEELHPGTTH